MIHVSGKKLPYGGACNKYYNVKHNIKHDIEKLNHVSKRKDFIFEKFIKKNPDIKENAPVIGINKSFEMHSLFPLFFNFFNELGCNVVTPDAVDESGSTMGMTSFCLSGQIALGMFKNLLGKKPDFIFSPQIMEINVSKQEEYRKEYQTVCMFIQGEPFYQNATFLKNIPNPPKLISPALNFMSGYDSEEKTFAQIAKDLGFTAVDGKKAYQIAMQKQRDAFKAMKEEGRRILADLEKNPDKIAVVLFGKPYNAFAEEANKGLPFKFASRGIEIIPFDYLEYEAEENYKGTYWEMGQRLN